MISPEDGSFEISIPKARLASETTIDDFTKSNLFAEARSLGENPPYARYQIGPVTAWSETCYAILYFRAGRLSEMQIAVSREEDGTSWADWSEEKELVKKQFHERLLQGMLGSRQREHAQGSSDPRSSPVRYEFPWGVGMSVYDPKGGSSSISVRYAEKTA